MIQTIKIERIADGTKLQGVCRWCGNGIQVEMTVPFAGLVCHLHSAMGQRLTYERAKAIAEEELVRIYTDVKEIAEDDDKDVSDWFWDKYHTDRLETIRRQMRLLKEFDTIRHDLQDGKIGKQEYRMQAWLLANSFQ